MPPSTKKRGGHLVQIGDPWRAIREAAKVDDLRLHDLRRSFGSWLAGEGVDLLRIKDALRHANISTTLIYARLAEDPAREGVERVSEKIMAAAGRHRPVAVVGGDGKE